MFNSEYDIAIIWNRNSNNTMINNYKLSVGESCKIKKVMNHFLNKFVNGFDIATTLISKEIKNMNSVNNTRHSIICDSEKIYAGMINNFINALDM